MLNLPHVASRVFGTPLMIGRAKLEVILGVLAPRLTGSVPEPTEAEADPAPLTSVTVERIAVISVIGTLVSRSGYLEAASGLQSYGEIGGAIAAAMDDPTVRGVILDVDSPGGEIGGLFDLVEQLQAVRKTKDKPLWAVANESALSAAYAIASATERLYVTRTGEVGSIGVVAVHVDESGADSKAGLAWTFVFAGERKVDGNAHEPLSERARATVQADVDRLYGELCALVAANRGLTTAGVRATDAAIYRGDLAARAGLADRVGTLDLAITEMAAELDRAAPMTRTSNPSSRRSPSMSTDETERIQQQANEPAVVSEAGASSPPTTEPGPSPGQASVPQARQPGDELARSLDSTPDRSAETGLTSSAADKLRAEFAEIAAIATQAARLGVTVDAADAVRKGVSADALRRSVLDTLAARAEATNVIAAAPSPGPAAVGDSPIVRRAKERAAGNSA